VGDIDAAGRDHPDAEPDHSTFCRHPEKPVTPKGNYAHSEQGNIFWVLGRGNNFSKSN
jgi:hypothetical protein